MSNKHLWWSFIAVIVFSFAVLLYYGAEIYREAPPIPGKVVTSSGELVFTRDDILTGQNVWQSIGGQEVGSIWGHGAYVAPDWTADWLHREALYILNVLARREYNENFENLNAERRAILQTRLQLELRENTYDPLTETLTISPLRAQAIEAVGLHYKGLFMDDPDLEKLRDAYAIPANTIKDPEQMKKMNAFFFWTAWAAVTKRQGKDIT